jgi:beta-galactosidase/beta-glucuronidase
MKRRDWRSEWIFGEYSDGSLPDGGIFPTKPFPSNFTISHRLFKDDDSVQSIVGEILEKIWQFRLCKIESSLREILVVFRAVFELKERLTIPGLVVI